ncbi:hypothetical protein [Streptomyces sp. NPDC001348]
MDGKTVTTAEVQHSGASGVALRRTRAVVITLVAVLAVLVHHETVAPMTHIGSRAVGTAGMDHGPVPSAQGHADSGGPKPRAAAFVAADEGFCSGTATQHCSTASVDTVKLVPPAESAAGHRPVHLSGTTTGPNAPGTVNRAPPDLSLLSRLRL